MVKLLTLWHASLCLPLSIASVLPWIREQDPSASHVHNRRSAQVVTTHSQSHPQLNKVNLRLPVRGSLNPQLQLSNLSTTDSALSTEPIQCFEPEQFHVSASDADDCEVVINEIILRYPHPMQKQVWGFDDSADINLSLPKNLQWIYGRCLVAVGSLDETQEGHFSPVDVALITQNIVEKCVRESKSALGGTTNIGALERGFYVVVGGKNQIPSIGDSRERSNLHNKGSQRSIESGKALKEEASRLRKRSINPAELMLGRIAQVPIACIKSGQHTEAGRLNVNDCSQAASALLEKTNVLRPQIFTTEPTGGVHVPYVQQEDSCFLMLNTHSQLSTQDVFGWIKVVYCASEVIRQCALGGVAQVTGRNSGFFVSVTGVAPGSGPGEAILEDLWKGFGDGNTGVLGLENSTTSGQTAR